MPRSRRNRPWKPRRRRTFIHLDTFSLKDVLEGKRAQEEFIKVYWDWFNELAYQRSQVVSQLKGALTEAAIGPFDFPNYYRTVKYKWSHDPLSVRGSVLDVGGRFNFGEIDRIKFPPFPCLYLGADRITAFQELFQVPPDGRQGLAPQDLALSIQSSVTSLSVFGSLDTILDLTQPDRLRDFVHLIKDFKIKESIVKAGEKIRVKVNAVQTVPSLMNALLYPNWRAYPMHVDVPATCQIFGQLVFEAGIEGIRYPSKYDGKDCLAIFPQNFRGKDSFVQLKDQPPPGVIRTRLDSTTVDTL